MAGPFILWQKAASSIWQQAMDIRQKLWICLLPRRRWQRITSAVMKGTCRASVLPPELDVKVAQIKLSSMGYSIDSLTEEQKAYLD